MIYYCEYNVAIKKLTIQPARTVVSKHNLGLLTKETLEPNNHVAWIDGGDSIIIAFNSFERLLRANRIEI